MARSGKRKASTASNDRPQKRTKSAQKQQNGNWWWDPDLAKQGLEPGLFPAKFIVEEHKKKGYLIRWEGTDEHGNPWPDSWGPKKDAGSELRDGWKHWKALHPGQRRRETSSEPESATAPEPSTPLQSDHEEIPSSAQSIYRANTPKRQKLFVRIKKKPEEGSKKGSKEGSKEPDQPDSEKKRPRLILNFNPKSTREPVATSSNLTTESNLQESEVPNTFDTINVENTQRVIPDSQAAQQATGSLFEASSSVGSSHSSELSDLSTGKNPHTRNSSGVSSLTSEEHLQFTTGAQSQQPSDQQSSQLQSTLAASEKEKSNTQSSAGFEDPYSQSQASFKQPSGQHYDLSSQTASKAPESSEALQSTTQPEPIVINSRPVQEAQGANIGTASTLRENNPPNIVGPSNDSVLADRSPERVTQSNQNDIAQEQPDSLTEETSAGNTSSYNLQSSIVPASGVVSQGNTANLDSDPVEVTKPHNEELLSEKPWDEQVKLTQSSAQIRSPSADNNRDQNFHNEKISHRGQDSNPSVSPKPQYFETTGSQPVVETIESKGQQPLSHNPPDLTDSSEYKRVEADPGQSHSSPLFTSSSSVPQVPSQAPQFSFQLGPSQPTALQSDNSPVSSRLSESATDVRLRQETLLPKTRAKMSNQTDDQSQTGSDRPKFATQIILEQMKKRRRPLPGARPCKYDPVTRKIVYLDEQPSSIDSPSTASQLPPDDTQGPGLQQGFARSHDIEASPSSPLAGGSQRPAQTNLPLPLSGSTQDIYARWFDCEKDIVDSFLNSHDPSSLLGIKSFIEKLNYTSFHSDLVYEETSTQKHMSSKADANYAIETSSKFRFLATLFDATRDTDKHVALFVKPGRPMSITATFLKGRRISYRRPDLAENMRKYSRLNITLVGTDEESSQIIADRADLIIGMDDTFDAESSLVRQMKNDALQTSKSCPVLSLVAVNTFEHIARVLPNGHIDELERTKKLVSISRKYKDLGGIPVPPIDVDSIARVVAAPLLGTAGSDWKLPSLDLYPIDTGDGEKLAMSRSSPAVKGKGKRTASESSPASDTASKKPRVSTEVDNPDSSISVTRITDTATSTTSPKQGLPASARQNDEIRARLRVALKDAAQWKSVAENREETVAALQPQLEQLSHENMSLKSQLSSLEQYKTSSSTKDEKVRDLNVRIKELQDSLSAEQKRLAESEIPEQRELQAAREEASRCIALEKKLASQAQELSYVRDQYQNASLRATEESEETARLKEENDRLRAQASGEASRLKTMAQNKTDDSLEKEVERLTQMLKSREALLQKTGDENEMLKQENQGLKDRVGMTTRAAARSSSVPMPSGGGSDGIQRRGTPTPAQSSLLAPGGPAMRQALATAAAASVGGAFSGNAGAASGISRPGSRAASRAASRTGSPAPGNGGPPTGSFSTKMTKG